MTASTPVGIGTIWQMELPNDCSANEPIDDATVCAAAAGDRSALRRIYEVTLDRVFRLMVQMVGQQGAGDLTQQTFVQAFMKMSQFSGDSKFETWRYRLATNESQWFAMPSVNLIRNCERSLRSRKRADCRIKRSPKRSVSPKARSDRGLIVRGVSCEGC